MAINPLISLKTKTPDFVGNISRGAKVRQELKQAPIRNQLLKSEAEQVPLQNQLLQAQIEQQPLQKQLLESQNLSAKERARQVIETGELSSIAQGALRLKGFLDNDNIDGARNFLFARQRRLNDPETNEAISLLESGNVDGLKQNVDNIINASLQMGFLKNNDLNKFQRGAGAIVQTDEGDAFATPVFDPATGTQRVELSQIPGTLTSRMGETPEEQTERRVGEKKRITEVVNQAKSDADEAKKQKSNSAAFSVWNTAMNNLVESLGGTITGPVSGWLPAFTANQQIADGSISVMAPVLKQLFRSAGEGNFTDKDQEMLLGMIPTRSDLPEARIAKVQAIDSIVRAKLGIDDQSGTIDEPAQQRQLEPQQNQQSSPQVLRFDAQGNLIQ